MPVRPLAIRCGEDGCANRGKVINTISGFESEGDRTLTIEQWHGAHTDADYCPRCGKLGIPDEEA